MTRRLILVLLIFFPLALTAQHTIYGRVIDVQSNTPLPGANVFLANTTKGTSTNVNGEFRIDGLQPVHYQLVISFVGYTSQVIDIVPSSDISYKIQLQPAAKTLNEVVIRSRKTSRMDWLSNFKIFKEHFIGLSENARHCSFENPRILKFENENGVLTATADTMLHMENRGLGYRIKILLEKYEFNIISYRVHYEGQIVYEALEPKNEREKKQWAKNRIKAYYGSEMHFLRTMYKRNLNDEGYYFNVVDELTHRGYADTTKTPRTPIFHNQRIKMHTIKNYNRVIDSLSIPNEPLMKFKGLLEVQYIMEAEPNTYQTTRHIKAETKPQLSQIKLLKPAIIQPHGQPYPPDAIETRGYWSWELMAESLPLDYEPDDDLKTLEILTRD